MPFWFLALVGWEHQLSDLSKFRFKLAFCSPRHGWRLRPRFIQPDPPTHSKAGETFLWSVKVGGQKRDSGLLDSEYRDTSRERVKRLRLAYADGLRLQLTEEN